MQTTPELPDGKKSKVMRLWRTVGSVLENREHAGAAAADFPFYW
jgi:hypothetical protein